jgi:hypothetical protein
MKDGWFTEYSTMWPGMGMSLKVMAKPGASDKRVPMSLKKYITVGFLPGRYRGMGCCAMVSLCLMVSQACAVRCPPVGAQVEEILYQARSDFQDVCVIRSATFGNVLLLDGERRQCGLLLRCCPARVASWQNRIMLMIGCRRCSISSRSRSCSLCTPL